MRFRPAETIKRRLTLLVDVGLATWMVAISLYLASSWSLADNVEVDHRLLDARGVVLILLVHFPLVVRRYWPVPVLLAVCGASLLYLLAGYFHSVVTFAVALAVFSVAAYRPRKTAIPGAALGIAVIGYENWLGEPGFKAVGLAIALVITLIAWVFGDNTYRLAERGARLAELTEQLRREQEARARQAVAQEQSRIARELHDVVAHHMSVISVQAGLGRYVFDSDPSMTRRTLSVIGDTAHEALGEMRRLLAMLRTSAEEERTPYDAAPGLARLPDLVERVRQAGAQVELVATGKADSLSPGAELCVFRVVQESLTNVLKHADPPIATVTLDWRPEEVRVAIVDVGRGAARLGTETGHGLIGMSERARIYRGRLTAGPRPEGGFGVLLHLPTKEPDE